MANYVPFQGGVGSEDGTYGPSGGYLLPPEQGEILVNGILVETGAIQLAGDARATRSRRTHFPIWLGRPDAQFVGEGQPKPVTGASLGQGTLNIKKAATIVVFTDEQIEDMMNGDLNVLVDSGVRQALSVVIDQNAVGSVASSAFDSTLLGTGSTGVPLVADTVSGVNDQLQRGVSAAMGILESNGYGNPQNMGVLLGFGWQQVLRDARMTDGRPIYDGGTFAGQSIDPLYSLDRAHSTALPSASSSVAVSTGGVTGTASVGSTNAALVYPGAPVFTSATNNTVVGTVTAVNASGVLTFSGGGTLTTSNVVGQPKAVVFHKPNVHVRVRQDVQVTASNEASIAMPTQTEPYQEGQTTSTVSLFQNNLTAIRYECRLGYFIHDAARAVVPIWG